MPRGLSLRMAVVLLAGTLGCSGAPRADYSQLKLVDVHGMVTLDGKPLPKAVVTFDAEDGQFSYGMTDSSGNYTLQLDSVQKGVTPGKKTVRISTTRKILGLNTSEGEGESPDGASAEGKPSEAVPAQYNAKSELTVDVSPSNREHNFDLKSN